MKLWIKTLFKDLLAGVLLLSLFYYAGNRYLEIVSSKIRGSGDPIGVVSDISYYPKRQLTGDEYTYNLNREDDLFEGDTISSDSFSSILMNLADGTEISLENNSRIILSLEENTIYFDGTISALSTGERENPLQLINLREQNPQPIILGQSSEITISTDDKGVFNMAVLTGNVSRGEDRIRENEQFRLTPEGEKTVDTMSFILKSPANNSSWVTFTESQNILFSWDEPQRAETRSLWVSLDTDFERIVFQADDLTELNYELDLLPGDYFWRVGNGEEGQYSSTGKIKIIDNLPLKSLLPAEDAEFTYRDQVPSPTFMWQGAENADFWELEIGNESDPENPVITQITRYNQLKVDSLEEGSYWWRVTAQYKGMENIGKTSPTPPKEIVITRQEVLQPPELISPEQKAELAPENFAEGVRFSWKGDPEIPLYQFILSESVDMADPLIRENTSKNYYDYYGPMDEGAFFWQVVPLTDGTIPVEPSEIRNIISKEKIKSIEQLSPASGEAVTLEKGGNLIFLWDSSERGNFRFRLWKVTDGAERIVANSRLDRLEISQYIADEGDYLWQVDIMDDKDRAALEGTRRAFSVKLPLLPPHLIYPGEGSSISLIGEAKLSLSWTEVANSLAYSGALYKEGDLNPVLTLPETESTSADVDISLLSEGTFTMELQSVREEDGKGFPNVSHVSRSTFDISDIVTYEAPVITAPADRTVTNRLDVLQNGLSIRWRSTYAFPSYSVALKQKESGTLLLRRVTDRTFFRIDDLYPDDYIIEINGIDNRNRLSPVGTAEISVDPVETLPAVTVLTPSQGETVDMSDRDTLEFRWRRGEEDELYTLALYDQSGNRIFSLDDYRSNEFVFTDLSKLDVGRFVFTIKAVKEYNSLGIVRTAPEKSINFSITLQTIGEAPVILSPDIQYAD